jgi:hypothetical protein
MIINSSGFVLSMIKVDTTELHYKMLSLPSNRESNSGGSGSFLREKTRSTSQSFILETRLRINTTDQLIPSELGCDASYLRMLLEIYNQGHREAVR